MKKIITISLIILLIITGCATEKKEVVQEERFGIYSLDLTTEKIDLIYTSSDKITGLRLNNNGDKFVFSAKYSDETIDTTEEIMSVDIDGTNLVKLTDNEYLDAYPEWSSDDKQIYFLSMRDNILSIYSMNIDGSEETLLYNSGYHDADVDNVGEKIVFTSESKIWIMDDDGSNVKALTNPSKRGEWGNAVLPFGDYDPRLSPDKSKVIFSRLDNDETVHGNYNLYLINSDGTEETQLTNNGYTQGLSSWSHSRDKITYVVSAMGDQGKYDIYMMNSDGTNNQDIMPSYVPANFLANHPVFSKDDSKIYFIGEWWS